MDFQSLIPTLTRDFYKGDDAENFLAYLSLDVDVFIGALNAVLEAEASLTRFHPPSQAAFMLWGEGVAQLCRSAVGTGE
ncbi:hypothetical protein BKD74_07360 [Corynebacterium diphtheriae]|uniref:hypothetical protein n=1 Tax=Corynebacterium diphtheriae TaxID=1717 RepID=UPI0002FD781E|nr:hypothetical protein [Corynebacterium diphtheriae]KJJ59049.1 hypothetical protein NG01_09740 [Corynebacterium diphtheriae]MBG9247256.1 hypothetical protein [Corynebacterium diphtheriae bv. mitis]MBG9257834.1 hypothetical protein [Corynebacterium diphtheriae bv. mitis]MBG9290999.1 hypothetical protein [Corynebacterium diphtheriae bv. gravis]OJH93734.1 hypothetical protein BKD74_07360 [Corynebacterium diphtheriae]